MPVCIRHDPVPAESFYKRIDVLEQLTTDKAIGSRDFLRKAFDYSFVLYAATMCGNKTGVGFDAIFCRAAFVLFVMVALLDILRQNERAKLISAYTMWLYVFVGYAFCSLLWCQSVTVGLEYFTIFIQYLVAGTLVIYRIKDREDVDRYLFYFVIAFTYMCVMALIKTPSMYYWKQRIGEAIGLHANDLGRRTAIGVMLCVYFIVAYKKIWYLLPAALFFLVNLMTGSRLSFIILVFGVCGFLFLLSERKKLLRNTLIIIVLLAAAWYVMMENEAVYDLLGRRMEGLFAALTGRGVVDDSTLGRRRLRYMAQELFQQHPLFGVGVNNFKAYLRSIGYYFAVYAHNNYWELLSTLGIVGTALYYSFYVYLTVRYLRLWPRRDPFTALALTFLLVTLVADYGSMSFLQIISLLMVAVLYANLRVKDREMDSHA